MSDAHITTLAEASELRCENCHSRKDVSLYEHLRRKDMIGQFILRFLCVDCANCDNWRKL